MRQCHNFFCYVFFVVLTASISSTYKSEKNMRVGAFFADTCYKFHDHRGMFHHKKKDDFVADQTFNGVSTGVVDRLVV